MQENDKKDVKKRDYKREATYKRHYACVLTKAEGETLDKIIIDNGCKNLSQLCKKIVHGKPVLW